MKNSRLWVAIASVWSFIVYAVGWPSVRLPGGELWWSAVATVGAWTVAPWIILGIVTAWRKSKGR